MSKTGISFKQIFIGLLLSIFVWILFIPTDFIQPRWLEAKITAWLFFAFTPLTLSGLQKIKSHFKISIVQNILIYYGVILIVSYKAIIQAVYKFSL